ncbi:S8 family serine peptidase [Prevotella sp. PINT]|uniref:S8 family serine peptidase n=1 Tax=Palleniella intestinalis TaxID=2736291 RepID=UPI001553CF6D|nr:S8 family serine peptidase [Palleniella intestinalis]NPD83111.1 S8 family serine peptidase [Palleniella intestinalis]
MSHRNILHTLLFIMLFPTAMSGQKEKMSSLVRKAWLEHSATTRSKGERGEAEKQRIMAFVKTSSGHVPEGCRVLAEFPNNLFVASIPLAKLGDMARSSDVVRIEAGMPCTATNDTAAVVTRQGLVWEMPREEQPMIHGYTGRGVVVGLMDIGFDLTHPTFLCSDGKSLRIRALWDQLDRTESGQPVIDADTVTVGRQYVGDEALMAKSHSTDATFISHGTHTAGSAAGSGRDGTGITPYKGMAPDADICLVANYTTDNHAIVPEEERYRYTSATDVLGFKYIFDYAASVGKPCVASFSEGSRMGFYGDDILMQEALAALQGEGRIIVASAGNEAIRNTHILKTAEKPSAGAFIQTAQRPCYTFRSTGSMTLRLTFYPDGMPPVAKDITTEEILACEEGFLTDTVRLGGITFPIAAAAYSSAYNNEETATEFLISRTDNGFVGRDISVSLELVGEGKEIEAYSLGGYFTANTLNPALADCDNTHNILSPGGLEGILCVGATNARNGYHNHAGIWQTYNYGAAEHRADYSSIGPTVAGLVKPDVCAPGTYIKSALSGTYIANGGDLRTCTEQFTFDGRTYGWAAFTGTSMSTPIVSGIVATWLEACPTLTPRQVTDIIAHTANPVPSGMPSSRNPPTYGELREKNVMDGYGVIDAYAGLRYILDGNATGIRDLDAQGNGNGECNGSGVVYDLHGRRVVTPVPGRIYVRNGRKKIFK